MKREIWLVLLIAMISTGCKKTPGEIFRGMFAKKVKSAPKVAEHPAVEEISDQTEEVVETTETEQVSDSSQNETIAEPQNQSQMEQVEKDYKACRRLMRTMVNEPYFYQFQANVRDYRDLGKLDELVGGHAKYHGIRFTKTSNPKFNKAWCGEVIASFDRYQDFRKVWYLPNSQLQAKLENQHKVFTSGQRYFSLDRCIAVIGSITDESEFVAFSSEMSRSWNENLSPETMMTSMLADDQGVEENSGSSISPRGCIKALQTFKTYAEVKSFQESEVEVQRARIGGQAEPVVAH